MGWCACHWSSLQAAVRVVLGGLVRAGTTEGGASGDIVVRADFIDGVTDLTTTDRTAVIKTAST